MINGQAIRGTRVGAGPESMSERGRPVERQHVSYWCANGHETSRSFALNADFPLEWDCRRCGWPASLDEENPPGRRESRPYKTHLAYVMERRSKEEAEEILAEALAARAAARGELRASA
ncbi:RNA polymerase-binding protein RbpA [Natronoglycomyces albus]|uniref:RNA polymerase-binding protein RbpA n=1 Tax=Natronoglycomyces albus TaxID=2811108 RepID=A0A895XNI8_9ACTN|nr:RNA polymerase-binding protein RbpA [Natronoglycomyces albus]QSB03870.1 RNA polymerase-binding protein RbpA [Natronoglycomyces albus]